MSILQVQHISKKFGGLHAVEKLHFVVQKNSITGLIGPNGAGKTTAFNLITHFLPRNEGHIFFQNENLKRLAPHRLVKKGLARSFQQIRLFPNLTVQENLLLALSDQHDRWWRSFFCTNESNENKEVVFWLKKVKLEKYAEEKAENLSYGQQKLVSILRVVLTGADLILLDEPASGINPTMLQTIESLVLDLKKSGKTILVIEHNMNFLMKISDEVVVMENGKFLCQDVPKKVQKDEKVLAAYLGG